MKKIYLLLALAACGGGSSETSDDDASSSTGSGTAAKCYDVAINDRNDGSSACGPVVCEGGQYCLSDAGICDPGCRNELECPRGQHCDLANAMNGIGLCRVPGPEHEVACTSSKTCEERCQTKAAQCNAPPDTAESYCAMLCPMLSQEQIGCIETSSCEQLGQLMEGQSVCGISPGE
ncbi:MAG TPA: hypothetical protein VFB62_11475 [Polyangiaceae bacterium]|jgi:hypothetical protein|nr:hypothetical protein [Polyangiaceae bacterium]